MLNKIIFKTQQHQTGVTIVELMISIVLGLLLLSAATAMTVKSMVMNGDTLGSAKLNQDLDSVLHVMVNDIRRAGYSGQNNSVTPVIPAVVFSDNEDLFIESQSCVLYAYDASPPGTPGAGVLETTEKFGFKLVANAIQMRTECSATGTACADDCDAGTWEPLTDPNRMTIRSLTFDTQFSKCLNIPATKTATNNNNYWVTTADNIRSFPCSASSADAADLTSYYLDADGVYQVGSYIPPDPGSGDRTIETRQVNIELAGHLGTDPLDAKSTVKRQKVAINVRNNSVETH